MSDVMNSFRTYALTKSAVTNEVSTRIYPDELPQNVTLPAATLQVITENPEHHMTAAAELTRYRLQVDVYAVSRNAANAVQEGFRNAADGYRGAMGGEYAQMCHLETSQTFYEPPVDRGDQGRYGVTMDWIIQLTETAPSL